MKKIVVLSLCLFMAIFSHSQKKKAVEQKSPAIAVDQALLKNVNYRLLGPFRGGRSGSVTGSYKNKNTFFFGSTGGGVWKTTNGGSTWSQVNASIGTRMAVDLLMDPTNHDLQQYLYKPNTNNRTVDVAPLRVECYDSSVSGI
jgi:hypothetical protein